MGDAPGPCSSQHALQGVPREPCSPLLASGGAGVMLRSPQSTNVAAVQLEEGVMSVELLLLSHLDAVRGRRCLQRPGGGGVKFDPPFNLSSNFSNNKFVISWSVESVRSSFMRYELQYKKQTVAWEKSIVKDLRNSVQKVELEASELENDVAYVARLRCKTEEQYSHYRSRWSEWSSHVTFNHPAEKAKLDAIHLFIYLLIPLILVFSIGYLLLNFKRPARVRMSLWKAIPTPADFFLPLYRDHNGNFQDWIRPQDTCDFKTEVEKEGQNLSPFAIITASNLQEEAISQISYIQPQSKNSNTLGEDVCSSLHPSDMTVQQFVESAYVGVNEAERGLSSFFTQDHHNQKTIVSVSEYSKTSDVALIFGDMATNHSIDVQGEQDSLLFQEFSESGCLHFASDEYSALLYDDFSQSLVPREMLSLLEDSKQFCQKNN